MYGNYFVLILYICMSIFNMWDARLVKYKFLIYSSCFFLHQPVQIQIAAQKIIVALVGFIVAFVDLIVAFADLIVTFVDLIVVIVDFFVEFQI